MGAMSILSSKVTLHVRVVVGAIVVGRVTVAEIM